MQRAVVVPNPVNPKEKSLYEEGLKAIEKKNFRIAVEKFDTLLQVYPTSRWLVGAFYSLGLSYEPNMSLP